MISSLNSTIAFLVTRTHNNNPQQHNQRKSHMNATETTHGPRSVKFSHDIDNGVTVGYRINPSNQTIEYAFSYTHSNDVYNHKMGRTIVQGRLLKGGKRSNGKDRSHTITFAALKQLSGTDEVRHGTIAPALHEIGRSLFHANRD